MKYIKALLLLMMFISISVAFHGCKQIQSLTQNLLSLQRLQFKLENVNDFKLAGISLSNKKSISDLSIMDGVNLGKAFATKKFPAEFTLNVAAKNPNDGKNQSQSTMATLTSFDWKMYIDDNETIAGNINKSIDIPGTGQTSIIPLSMSLDLYQFFGNKGYDQVVNLAMAIGGVGGSAARLKLDAMPTVSTPIGPIKYPSRITIVDKQFTN